VTTPTDRRTPEIFWEDLSTGTVFDLGTYEVTKEEILEFAKKYDPQPFHTDEKAAEESIFGGLIASGWHTCSMMMRLFCDGLLARSASMGSPGVDQVRWLKPVRPGDTLHARLEIIDSRASRSKPDRGVVRSRWDVRNQDGEQVMTMEGMGMYRRREPGA
jgi:acyl dehydratase